MKIMIDLPDRYLDAAAALLSLKAKDLNAPMEEACAKLKQSNEPLNINLEAVVEYDDKATDIQYMLLGMLAIQQWIVNQNTPTDDRA